ncbi:hypothetical protein A2230_02580 [candidate division WOR-1 bacterium RIFOXYA2_FULL_36_21]|uniref:DUF6438 domain-containing protein n=1 Tax=candidate division WOR-1 bacterium RIFOXYB2_FULL_36_35 TaxID=1802578 RepID=A0A1F4RZB4_UNCSA|nr:MAG: hypothetical protein A2230_02580 [candidate division WOR-1 bacterium RIFOXYA2_FULL_36_21]OGC13526.1 MAG: hypothetical protein A2290_02280 [candidate division WOR-1 bacterium RIFOXYB2_FULL_36_35]OGC16832.1 MAG: hypothetical protein A2282_02410 [candidate division WOR-1 bacterium RIFOXYA12_FULL_36_13]
MQINKFASLFMVVPFFLFMGVAPIDKNIDIPDPEITPPIITLARGSGRGTPSYSLAIYDDGLVIYEGKLFVKTTGIKKSKIDKESLNFLLSTFENEGYFSFKDEYFNHDATDMPNITTSVKIGNKNKKISHYRGDFSAPKKLIELENKIDEAVNSKQWVK